MDQDKLRKMLQVPGKGVNIFFSDFEIHSAQDALEVLSDPDLDHVQIYDRLEILAVPLLKKLVEHMDYLED